MVRALRSAVTAFLCLMVPATGVMAAPASFWERTGFDDFAEGELDGVMLSSSGTLALGPRFEGLPLPEADYAWAAARAADDVVFVTTGSPGRLVRIEGDDVQVLHEEPSSDLPALAVSPTGDVYVGTAPGGQVLRMESDGEVSVFFETGQAYIWDMAWSDEHGLIVGTGDSAVVYAVDERGRGSAFLESNAASVVRVASGHGRVLAGTAPDGMLLDATPGARERVLYDSRFEEIAGVVVGPDDVWFAGSTVLFEEALGEDSTFDQTFGEGGVLRLHDGASAIDVWQSLDAPLTAFGVGPGGSLWAGAGTGGVIHSLSGDRASIVARGDSEEILSISPDGEGTLVAAGLPAAVWRVGALPGTDGVYVSDILDAGQGATWGSLQWRADVPSGASLALSTRSGNSADPDETWSSWSPVEGTDNGPIVSPRARFLQWRADFSRRRDGDSPRLYSVAAAFLGANRPPVLESVRVFETNDAVSEGDGGYGATAARQSFPSGLEVTYNIGDGAGTDGLPAPISVLRTIEWQAYDPDGDRLEFDVRVRSDREDIWKPLVSDIQRTAHTWDSRSMPDGYYRVLVEATDRRDRPDGPGAVSLESEPFLVDNGRPFVRNLDVRAGDGVITVEGLAGDELSPVTAIDVSIDYGDWERAFADDGLVDSREERFSLSMDHPGSGEHAVAVRAVDRHGNAMVVREVVRLR